MPLRPTLVNVDSSFSSTSSNRSGSSVATHSNRSAYSKAWTEASYLTKVRGLLPSRSGIGTTAGPSFRRENQSQGAESRWTSVGGYSATAIASSDAYRETQQRGSAPVTSSLVEGPRPISISSRKQSESCGAVKPLVDKGRMKIEDHGLNDGGTCRRSSKDLGNWIDKYQNSDHHVDRLVRTVVQYESTTGQQYPDKMHLPASVLHSVPKQTAYISALPELVYVRTADALGNGPVYADGHGQLRRLSVDRSPSSRRSSFAGSLPAQQQSSVYQSAAYPTAAASGRPPRSSLYLAVDQASSSSRAASLPPPSPSVLLDPSRRRPSVSSTASPPAAVTYRQRAASVVQGSYGGLPPRIGGLPSSDIQLASALASARRASYSDGFNEPVRRSSLVTSSYSTGSGSNAGSRSTSVERSAASGQTITNYSLSTAPTTPNMSHARRKIRRVLHKVSGDNSYYLE